MSTTTLLPMSAFTSWLASGERGLSSEAIVRHLTGQPVGRDWGGGFDRYPHHPHDPSDFRRCELLLTQVPLARLTFSSMRTASPVWSRLVDNWDEIDALFKSEAPDGDYLNPTARWSAHMTYVPISRLVDGGISCADCDGTGRSGPCEKCKGTGRRAGGRCRAEGCRRGHHDCRLCRGRGYVKKPTA